MRPTATFPYDRASATWRRSPRTWLPVLLLSPTFPLYGLGRPARQLPPAPFPNSAAPSLPPSASFRPPSLDVSSSLRCPVPHGSQVGVCEAIPLGAELRGPPPPSPPRPAARPARPPGRLARQPRSRPAAASAGAGGRPGQRRARPRPRPRRAPGNFPRSRRVAPTPALESRARSTRAEHCVKNTPKRGVGRTDSQKSKTQGKRFLKKEKKCLLGLLSFCSIDTHLAIYLPPSNFPSSTWIRLLSISEILLKIKIKSPSLLRMRLEHLILSYTQTQESLCLDQSLFSLPTLSSTTFPIKA